MIQKITDYPCQSAESYLCTILYSVGLYILIIICVRLIGKRGLSDFSLPDLILLIIIGESIGSIIPDKNSFPHAVTSILSLVGANFIIDRLSFKCSWFKKLVDGKPVVLIENGIINEVNLRKNRLTKPDLKEALRINGINDDLRKLSEDLYATLETDGKISLIHKK